MYYLLYGILYLISLVPMRLLYIFCDVLYFIVYRILGYRKKVVMDNLTIAFPNKSIEERKAIAKQFYKNFIDNFIEAIKMLSAGKSFIEKRYRGNFEVFDKIKAEGKSAHLHLGHFFNWEVGIFVLGYCTPLHALIVYMPIKSPAVEKLFLKLRQKSGAAMIPATPTSAFRRGYMAERKNQYVIAFVADQNPGGVDKSYWLSFFGRPTPFVTGPEKSAKMANMPVVFGHFTKPKRGYYDMHFVLIEEDPKSTADGELTRRYVQWLEEKMKEHPTLWMWTHKRWKHEWSNEYEKLWIGEETPSEPGFVGLKD